MCFSSLYLGTRYVFYLRTIYKSKRKLAINSLYSCGDAKPQIPLGLIDGAHPVPPMMLSKLYSREEQLLKWVQGKVKVIQP